ncbi:sialidase family protein [Sphingobacterium paucimobilis]|uniref:sialidase family protein n=1 Tax=Sphingobacterium paucimobilis TaxID=1385985 RepID=UPI0003B72910|nr:sialidase family protein [Sphingobacterium paucimobilis]
MVLSKNLITSIVLLLCVTSNVALIACKSDEPTKPVTKPGGNGGDNDGEDPTSSFNYIYKENTGGFQVYRIPAIVKANSGRLLAFAEARKLRSGGDSGDIDMVVKLSDDNGKTWGNMITIWDEGVNTCGNPVPIVDKVTGKIHLLLTWNNGADDWAALTNGTGKDTRRVYYTSSSDEGATWSKPREITSSVKSSTWDWYATGPVHGIQISKGTYKGRLVSPNYFTERVDGRRQDLSHAIYSDDNGLTWKSGAATKTGGVGECTVAELSDGRLMMNFRVSSGNVRKYSISEDGGETWGDIQTDYTLVDAICQGSLLSAPIDNKHMMFFANAASVERKNMTVKLSNDNGSNWTKKVSIHSGPSAYSDMTLTAQGKIALVYEGGVGRPYEGIAFKMLELGDFK